MGGRDLGEAEMQIDTVTEKNLLYTVDSLEKDQAVPAV